MTIGQTQVPADSSGTPALGGPAAALFDVTHSSQVGEVRRAAEAMSARVGLGEVERGRIALIVTEVATNLARHARAGRVLLSELAGPGAPGVEILALDEGPGIANVGGAMTDGFSTGGSAGQGLGAMQRLADEFDLFSRTGATPGAGTALVARVFAGGARRAGPASRLRGRAVCVALAGERACGDSWLLVEQRDRTLAVVADGLGHGPEAAFASSEAIRVISAHAEASPARLIELAHGALRPTRGAALAVAVIQPSLGTVAFAGVGNVVASIHTRAGPRSMASHNGTVGHVMRKVQEFSYDWSEDSTLVMHSDGLTTRWRLDAYPGLVRRDPALLAGVLFRDAARGRDDASVLVVREALEEDGALTRPAGVR